jgi:hypothetical protein
MSHTIPVSPVNRFRRNLDVLTIDLNREERRQYLKAAQNLVTRLTCELWAADRGLAIPQYGTPEWQEMADKWLNCGGT